MIIRCRKVIFHRQLSIDELIVFLDFAIEQGYMVWPIGHPDRANSYTLEPRKENEIFDGPTI